jgi:hypothetical protein
MEEAEAAGLARDGQVHWLYAACGNRHNPKEPNMKWRWIGCLLIAGCIAAGAMLATTPQSAYARCVPPGCPPAPPRKKTPTPPPTLVPSATPVASPTPTLVASLTPTSVPPARPTAIPSAAHLTAPNSLPSPAAGNVVAVAVPPSPWNFDPFQNGIYDPLSTGGLLIEGLALLVIVALIAAWKLFFPKSGSGIIDVYGPDGAPPPKASTGGGFIQPDDPSVDPAPALKTKDGGKGRN